MKATAQMENGDSAEAVAQATRLHGTTDGRVWAQEFNKVFARLHEGCELDEGWLIGWFANAIETGRAAGRRSLESVRSEALEEAAQACIKVEQELHWSTKWCVQAIRALSPARVAEGREKKDAARYRWLRRADDQDWNKLMRDGGVHLDERIDDAISAEEKDVHDNELRK